MDYRHFHRLMTSRGSEDKSDLLLLEEFVRAYPYCQTGHSLLTRSMYLQGHVAYEEQLKRTAIAVPDRTCLFNLIHGTPATASPTSPWKLQEVESPFRLHVASLAAPTEPIIEEPISQLFKPTTEPTSSHSPQAEELHSSAHAHDYEEPLQEPLPSNQSDDPHEIVRKRLEALLGGVASNQLSKETSEAKAVNPSEPTTATAVTASAESPAESITMEVDSLEQLELSHALEENILKAIEELPELPTQPSPAQPAKEIEEEVTPQVVAPELSIPRPTDFFSWLRSTSTSSFGSFEEIHAEDRESAITAVDTLAQPIIRPEPAKKLENAPKTDSKLQLIDQFIESSPRIVPQPKAEFFNPSVQAKRSVEEHDDLVSETLARIYADQGNLMKARDSYRKLSLLHPEKKAYFAALIKQLDVKLESNSEDL